MMEKRNLVEPTRTPNLNRQETLDALEKKAVDMFRPGEPATVGKACTCAQKCEHCCGKGH